MNKVGCVDPSGAVSGADRGQELTPVIKVLSFLRGERTPLENTPSLVERGEEPLHKYKSCL